MPTPVISIKADARAAIARLNDAARKQVPFATAKALTALAFDVQQAERAAMAQVFAHPRPFTQRSILVDKATKGRQQAEVFARPEADAYLAPFEFGGPHRVPGKGIALMEPVNLRLDQYGQIRGAPSSIAQRPGVFVGEVITKRGPVWGFWQRLAGKRKGPRLKLLLEAAKAMPVKQHLHFMDRARTVIAHNGRTTFERELAKAIANARP